MQEASETRDLVGFSNQSDIRGIIMGGYKPRPIKTKFQEKYTVDKKTGCWLWNGGLDKVGSGTIKYEGKDYRAHRLSYQMHTGIDPAGVCICHKCDIRHCVNPEHLFLGTDRDNIDDKVKKDRQAKGESQGLSKLKDADVVLIKQFCLRHPPESGSPYSPGTFLARWFGVTGQTISYIRLGKTWKHIEVTE